MTTSVAHQGTRHRPAAHRLRQRLSERAYVGASLQRLGTQRGDRRFGGFDPSPQLGVLGNETFDIVAGHCDTIRRR
jgi:hypothetical protein